MRVEIHQGGVVREVIIRGVNTKVRLGNGGARHVQRINDLLKIGGGTIREDLIGENGEGFDEGKKSKMHCLFNQETNKSHDQRSSHMSVNKRSETDLRTIKERTIGNRFKNDQRKVDWKPI